MHVCMFSEKPDAARSYTLPLTFHTMPLSVLKLQTLPRSIVRRLLPDLRAEMPLAYLDMRGRIVNLRQSS